MVLRKSFNSVYGLRYLLFLPVDSSVLALSDDSLSFLADYFVKLGNEYGVRLIRAVGSETAVTFDFQVRPRFDVGKFVNAYKSASSRLIKRSFPDLLGDGDSNRFWSLSFLLLTLDGASSTYDPFSDPNVESLVVQFLEKKPLVAQGSVDEGPAFYEPVPKIFGKVVN